MSRTELAKAKEKIALESKAELEALSKTVDIGTAFLMQMTLAKRSVTRPAGLQERTVVSPIFKWPCDSFRPKISITSAFVCEDEPNERGFKDPVAMAASEIEAAADEAARAARVAQIPPG